MVSPVIEEGYGLLKNSCIQTEKRGLSYLNFL